MLPQGVLLFKVVIPSMPEYVRRHRGVVPCLPSSSVFVHEYLPAEALWWSYLKILSKELLVW